MSDRNMRLDVIVSLKDRLSSGLSRLKSGLQGIADTAKKIGLVGTAIAGISFMAPIQEAAAFQQKLIDISLTQGLTGSAAFASVMKQAEQYEDLALRVGQTSETIAAGAGQMTAAGVATDVINASIENISRAATAANGEFSDMAGVATSLVNTLGVKPEGLKDALGALAVAGKSGSFEMKDMAKYFPQLTSQMTRFGIKGREAVNFLGAGLQVAMKGAADPSIAANNFNNFLAKVLAPQTIKNFQEMGVNIEAVMKDAAAKGINPIEAMLQKIMKLTNVSDKDIAGFMKTAKARGLEGAEALAYVREQLQAIGVASKIGNLFGDMQVMDFLTPMLANIDEYKRIKAEVAAATGEVIDKDFDTQMEGLNRQLIRFGEIGTQAVRFVGMAFGKWLPTMGDNAEAALRGMRELDAATGGWVSQGLVAVGGVILLTGALGALGLALPIVGAGLSAIGAIVGLIFGPVGLVIAAIAGGAALVYQNWDRVGPRLRGIWDRSKDGLVSFGRSAMDAGRSLISSGRELATRYGPAILDGIGGAWTRVREVGGRAMEAVKKAAGDFFSGTGWTKASIAAGALDIFTAALGQLQSLARSGLKDVRFVVDLLGSFFNGFATQMRPMGKSFAELVGSIKDLGSSLAGLFDATDDMAGAQPIDWVRIFGDIGNFVGREIAQFAREMSEALREVQGFVDALRGLKTEASNADSSELVRFGRELREAFEDIKAAIEAMTKAWNNFKASIGGKIVLGDVEGAAKDLGTTVNPETGRLGKVPMKGGLFPGLTGALGRATGSPPASNGNTPPVAGEKQSWLQGSSRFAALERAPAQRIDAGGTIRVQVDGPGRVAEATTNDSRLSMVPDRGRGIGRA